jgi:hypothetical protein
LLSLRAHYAHEWSTANTGALASYPPLTVPSALGIKLAHDVMLTLDTVRNAVTKVPRSLAASSSLAAPAAPTAGAFGASSLTEPLVAIKKEAVMDDGVKDGRIDI